MLKIEQTYDQIVRYLKGLLSNRERHDLEKEMMRDAFEEDAFEGLNRLAADKLEADMDVLMNRLDDRLENGKKRNLVLFYRIAAAIILLVGVGSILYVVFRTPSENLITQETNRSTKQVPVVTIPAEAQESPVIEAIKSGDISKSKQEVPIQIESQMKLTAVEETAETVAADEMAMEAIEVKAAAEEAEQIQYEAPAPAREKKSETMAIRGISTMEPSEVLSAKVVDSQGQPLPGVNVLVKGTRQGTVTDMDGNFTLQAPDTSPVLALNYIGFKPLELQGKEIKGREITMMEDETALNEVVVVDYGRRQESVLSGKAAGVEVKDNSNSIEPQPAVFINPVPPGGSLKEFKKWVDERLDYSKFKDFPGKNKIQVTLTVKADGSVRDIGLSESAPAPITEEIKQIIAQSPPWQAALKDNSPVEAQVVIRFVITVE
jgi:hypothetical protein